MSAKPKDTELRDQLTEAFQVFREALEAALQSHAQQSVDAEIERLAGEHDIAGFRVLNATVSVELGGVAGPAGGAGSVSAARLAAKPRRTPRAAKTSGRRSPRASKTASSRKRGAIGDAVIATFTETDEDLTIGQLHERLAARGVETSVNNLHQQMRRLVAAGILERVGRGVYRRSS